MSLKTVIPQKSYLGDQFWGISREFPRNQLQEMFREIPRKFFKKIHHIWRIWGNFSLLLPQEHLSVENNFLKNYLIFSGLILWQPVMHSQVHFSESFTLHSGVHYSVNFIKN